MLDGIHAEEHHIEIVTAVIFVAPCVIGVGRGAVAYLMPSYAFVGGVAAGDITKTNTAAVLLELAKQHPYGEDMPSYAACDKRSAFEVVLYPVTVPAYCGVGQQGDIGALAGLRPHRGGSSAQFPQEDIRSPARLGGVGKNFKAEINHYLHRP